MRNGLGTAEIGDNRTRDNADGQGVCPDGRRLPTDEDWTELTDFLGREYISGIKLKTSLYGGTNESSFSVTLNGKVSHDGHMEENGYNGHFWSATEYNEYPNDEKRAWKRDLFDDSNAVLRWYSLKSTGLSVRYVQN